MTTPFLGEDFEAHVETTTPGTFELIGDMNNFSKNVSREQQTFPVFGRATPYGIPGARESSYTLSGFLSTDAGQERLRTLEQSDSVVKIKILWDGTNGFTQDCRVGTVSIDATPEGLQEISFELSAVADAVIVGTGPLL